MMRRRRGWELSQLLLKFMYKCAGRGQFVMMGSREKISWHPDVGAVCEKSRCCIQVLFPCCPDAKHDHWQFIHPTGSVETCFERCLETAMESFYHSISLGMVGSGVLGLDPKDHVKFTPQSTDELTPLIRSNGVWNTETGDPSPQQGLSTGDSFCVGKRNGFWPPCESVDNGEQVAAAF
jgi:hypothetical protein